jgi:serine/threonine protein kinase
MSSSSVAYFNLQVGMIFPLPADFMKSKPIFVSTYSYLYLTHYTNANGVKRRCIAKVAKKKIQDDDEYIISVELDHENVLTPLAMYRDKYYYVIFMPYCENGTLENTTLTPTKPTEPSCKFIFKQMAAGVAHLHEQLIIHNDIKLENFLVDGVTVKLADFGLSSRLSNKDALDPCPNGTPYYMAPEVHAHAGHTMSADIWSLGVSLHFLYYRAYPFNGDSITELKNSVFHSGWHPNR